MLVLTLWLAPAVMLDVGFQNRPFIGSKVGKVSLFPLIVLDIFDDYFEFCCISTLEYHHFLENMKDILLITFLNGRLQNQTCPYCID